MNNESLRTWLGVKKGESSLNDIDDDEKLIFIHHLFLKEYGWIPLEEFKKLPLPLRDNLLQIILYEKEKEREEYEKSKQNIGKRGRR